MKIDKVLTKAADLLAEDEKRWVKGSYSQPAWRVYNEVDPDDGAMCFCAVGAISHANGEHEDMPTKPDTYEVVNALATYLKGAGLTGPEWQYEEPCEGMVTSWNDEGATGRQDVIDALRAAAAVTKAERKAAKS